MAFKINIKSNAIYFLDSDILFRRKYDMDIREFIVYDNVLYILALPEITDTRLPEFKEFNRNNVFAFDGNGKLLWRKGKKRHKYDNRTVEMYASVIAFKDDLIMLYYQSNHEVGLHPKTGEKIKEEFVFKK